MFVCFGLISILYTQNASPAVIPPHSTQHFSAQLLEILKCFFKYEETKCLQAL